MLDHLTRMWSLAANGQPELLGAGTPVELPHGKHRQCLPQPGGEHGTDRGHTAGCQRRRTGIAAMMCRPHWIAFLALTWPLVSLADHYRPQSMATAPKQPHQVGPAVHGIRITLLDGERPVPLGTEYEISLCGELGYADCPTCFDANTYYFNRESLQIVSRCAGACWHPRGPQVKVCQTLCPPPEWNCESGRRGAP